MAANGVMAVDSTPGTVQVAPASRAVGAAAGLMLGSATSVQTGAALGALAFPAIGPAGVVAIRQLVSVAILLPLARPRIRRWTAAQWRPVVALAFVYAVMNLSVYVTVSRLGLGLAITLEFLGPLSIALLGSRGRRDLILAVLAGVGVYILVLPSASSDWVGIASGVLSASCWAAYILLNRTVGRDLPGLEAPSVAATISAALYLPVLVVLGLQQRFTIAAVLLGMAAGVLSSAVPYVVDMLALRRVTPRFFAVFTSVNPAIAAIAGMLVLEELLTMHQWAGIAIISAVNVAAVLGARQAPLPRIDREAEIVLEAPPL